MGIETLSWSGFTLFAALGLVAVLYAIVPFVVLSMKAKMDQMVSLQQQSLEQTIVASRATLDQLERLTRAAAARTEAPRADMQRAERAQEGKVVKVARTGDRRIEPATAPAATPAATMVVPPPGAGPRPLAEAMRRIA